MLKFGGTAYKLLQMHFHRPSEHLIPATTRTFLMEAHYVHGSET